jgi:hypothetical protein
MPKADKSNDGGEKIILDSVFSAISEPLRAILITTTTSVSHPGTKGDASEYQWLLWLKTYLPKRYEVNKGFVIDSEGSISEQQDIIIYDRQYTPYLLNKDGVIYVPAESVYAVVEVKQELSRAYIKYAGDKIKSVRCLKRTSIPIPWAIGKLKAKRPHRIIGCLVCLKSSWKKGIVNSVIQSALEQVKDQNSQIDLICCLTEGALSVSYGKNVVKLKKSTSEGSLTFFFIKLISELQRLATVPAIDFEAYSKTLKNFELSE